MLPKNRRMVVALAAMVALPLAPLFAQPEDDSRLSYSYVRTLEGRATLASSGNGPGEEADLHQILQRGDRIRIERNARVEIALADRNLLRVGGGSNLALVRVAFSADGDDRSTRIDLDRGELVLEVTDDALGDELPEIRTLSARIFVNEPGLYRVRTESDGYTELVVRSGYAELLTERGSTIVRSGEEAWTSGDRWRPVELASAGPRDALERWSNELVENASRARDRNLYVEPELAYAAAPLADYGSWVSVDASWYWRPRVASGWRPYYDGRWCWSPSGLTWVSSEPWGWVPYHYGTWSDLPGYGWAWRPGRVYSPAWVYWYWSDSWTGWCPTGYYTDFYRGHWNSGFRFGLYGRTGGHWGLYSHWNFGPTGRVCDRRLSGGWHAGNRVGNSGGPSEPNGILTTDTRGLPRDRWDRPDELVRVLERSPREGGRRDLPVVTDFVARKLDLPPLVDGAVRPERTDRPGRRVATPLDPEGPRAGGSARGARENAPEPQPGWRSHRPEADGTSERTSERGRSEVAPRADRGEQTPSSGDSSGSGARGRSDDGSRGRMTPPTPNNRQGWRSGDAAPDHSARATAAPDTRRQQPPVADGEEPSGRDHSDQSQGSSDRRYGFPAREIGGPSGATPTEPPAEVRSYRAGSRYDAPQAPPAAPVERVIGGVRRAAPESGQPRSWSSPNQGYSAPRPPSSGYGAPPAPAVRQAPARPQATGPGSSGGYAPPPRQAPTARNATPPAQRGGSTAGDAGRGRATQNSGQKASPPPSRSSSSSSSSSSSPPPKHRPRPADGD